MKSSRAQKIRDLTEQKINNDVRDIADTDSVEAPEKVSDYTSYIPTYKHFFFCKRPTHTVFCLQTHSPKLMRKNKNFGLVSYEISDGNSSEDDRARTKIPTDSNTKTSEKSSTSSSSSSISSSSSSSSSSSDSSDSDSSVASPKQPVTKKPNIIINETDEDDVIENTPPNHQNEASINYNVRHVYFP